MPLASTNYSQMADLVTPCPSDFSAFDPQQQPFDRRPMASETLNTLNLPGRIPVAVVFSSFARFSMHLPSKPSPHPLVQPAYISKGMSRASPLEAAHISYGRQSLTKKAQEHC